MIEKKKLVSIEIIRTLACIAVFNQHILGSMARQNRGFLPIYIEKLIMIFFELSRFAVPTFVFLFAYFMAKSKYDNYFSFLNKKIKQIYLPYLFISIICMWYTYTLTDVWIGYNAVISNIIFGNGYYHLWYIPMIFQFVLIAPIVFLLVNYIKNCKNIKLFYLVFSLICFLYMTIVPTLDLPKIIVLNYTRLFSSWFFYFGTGLICGVYSDKFKELYVKFLPLTILVSIFALGYAILKDFIYIKNNSTVHFGQVNFLSPMFAIFMMFEIFALFGIAHKCQDFKLVSKPSLFIGKHSFNIYLVHGICITYVFVKIREISPDISLNLLYLLLYPISLILSVLCSMGIDKITSIKIHNK